MQLQTPPCWQSAVKNSPYFLYLKENNNAIDDLRLRLVPKQRELRFSETDLVKQLQQPQRRSRKLYPTSAI